MSSSKPEQGSMPQLMGTPMSKPAGHLNGSGPWGLSFALAGPALLHQQRQH